MLASRLAIATTVAAVVHGACAKSGYGPGTPTVDAGADKQLRILTAERRPLQSMTLTVGLALELEAGLVAGDRWLESVPVVWTLAGSDLPSADLQWTPPASTNARLVPSAVGSVTVVAQRVGAHPSTAAVGPITIVSEGDPARLLVARGDQQRAPVAGPLPAPLVVRVVDRFGEPVAGVGVAFSALTGGGALEDPSPVLSDVAGEAAMRARLGARAGVDNHLFRAEIVGHPALSVTFSASATTGAPAALAFDQQPLSGAATATLFPQPVVSLRDAHGNLVTSTDDVSLTVGVGTGALTGRRTVAMVDGIARFDGLGYDTVESGVILRATAGALSVDAAPFAVGQLPPGACQSSDEHFSSAEGGCKDLATGLVWSKPVGSLNWHDAIWDVAAGGTLADAHDYGRTNDYGSESPEAGDRAPQTYCHRLVEGGRLDWRMPSRAELVALSTHLQRGSSTLADNIDRPYWSASINRRSGGVLRPWVINLASGSVLEGDDRVSHAVVCVAGGWSADRSVEITGKPAVLGVGVPPLAPLTIQLRDSLGNAVHAQDVTVSVGASAPTSGPLTAKTDFKGRASLAGWRIAQVGTVTITVSADDGSAPAQFSLTVGAFPHTCAKQTPGVWATANGGCNDLGTGLVWSRSAPAPLTWNEAVWDSANPPPPTSPPDPGYRRLPDAHDGSRTHDYSSDDTGTDGSYVDYCHDLSEGGYADWRVPSPNELNSAYSLGQGAPLHFGFDTDKLFWNGFKPTHTHLVPCRNLATGSVVQADRKGLAWTICVRANN